MKDEPKYGLTKPVYDLSDTREMFGGRSRATIYAMRAPGELRIVKIGGRSVVPREDIIAVLDKAMETTS